MERMHNSNLHVWGIARGLEVSGTIDGTEIIINPGVAIDIKGNLISLPNNGYGYTGKLKPAKHEPGVLVPVVLSTEDKEYAEKTVYVTIKFQEIVQIIKQYSGEINLSSLIVDEQEVQVPWLQLQPFKEYEKGGNEGESIILAIAKIDREGKLTELVGNPSELKTVTEHPKYHRRLIGQSIEELQIRRSSVDNGKNTISGKVGPDDVGKQITVKDTISGKIGPGDGGGLKISLTGDKDGITPAALEVDGDIKVSGQIIQSDLIPLKLTDGWKEYNSIYKLPDNIKYNPPGYFRDANGIVHLRGMIKKIDKGTDAVIFNLPAGYRPAYRELHIVFSYENLASRCEITPDGDVIISSKKGELISLDGVTFKVTKSEPGKTVDPKRAETGSALSSAVLDGSKLVYFIGNNNHIYELAHDGTNWVAQDLTKDHDPSAVVAVSALTSAVIEKRKKVYFIASDTHIYELAYDGSKWHYRDLMKSATLAAVAICALTSAVFEGSKLFYLVYYLGSDNHIHELKYSAEAIDEVKETDLMKIATSPETTIGGALALAAFSLNNRVYYIGSNNHIYKLVQAGPGWACTDLTPRDGKVPYSLLPASRSVLTTVVIESKVSILYLTGNNIVKLEDDGLNLRNLTEGATHFQTGVKPAPNAVDGSALTVVVLDKKNWKVYYIGSDNHIYELEYRDDDMVLWRDLTIDVTGPMTQLAAGSALTSVVVDKNNSLYCLGINNHIYELAYDGSNWQYRDLTKDVKWS